MPAAHPISAAAVVTEFGLRAEIVASLVARGILAIVDKPLATSLAGLAAIETALAGRDLVALMLEKRFYPVTLALRDLVADGALGEIVTIHGTGPHKLVAARRPAWLFDPAHYGGILADLAVHDIDLALLVGGGRSGTVSGWVSRVAAPGTAAFAGAGRLVLTMDSGVQASIEVDWLQPEASPRHGDYAMRVTGTLGRADLFFAENRLVLETHRTPARAVTLPEGAPPARFAFDFLTRGAPLAVPSADALRATRIALLGQQSAEQGGVVLSWGESVKPSSPGPRQ
jgi:predicted dehydrogenase